MINIFKYITLTESSLPSIHAEIKEIKDPYHPDTDLAVDLTFYNTNKERIAEASISGYNTDMPFLYNMEVFPKYRGQHYSNAIMSYLIKKYNPKQLTVRPSNKIAIHLYEKFGFRMYGDFMDGKIKMKEMRR